MPSRAAFWKKARLRVELPEEGTGVLGGTGRAGEGAAVGGPASGPGSVAASGPEASPLANSNAMFFAGNAASVPPPLIRRNSSITRAKVSPSMNCMA